MTHIAGTDGSQLLLLFEAVEDNERSGPTIPRDREARYRQTKMTDAASADAMTMLKNFAEC